MSALDCFDASWCAQAPALALASPARSSATTLSTDAYTPSGSASPVSAFRDEPAEQPPKEQAKQQPTRRTVHKISPLVDFTSGRALAYVKPAATVGFALPPPQQQQVQPRKQQTRSQPLQQSVQQQPAPAAEPTPFSTAALLRESNPTAAFKSAKTSTPVPIPGAQQDGLARSGSLIRAVPARVSAEPVAIRTNTQRGWAAQDAALVGSWAERQTRFELDRPSQQPGGLSETLKARNAAITARRSVAGQAARAPAPPEEVAWRLRFKRKWIREELFARQLDFPEDPAYDDAWQAAQQFLEACGPEAALQAAFLQAAPAAATHYCEDEALLGSADALLFPDDQPLPPGLDRSSAAEAGVAAKAAALVRLHRKLAAAA